jgi:putative selenate reductase
MGVRVSKVMKSVGLRDLLARIAGEYRAKGTIFDIPEKAFRSAFELEAESPGLAIMDGRVSLPVGPAAGPHSQIAPNIVAGYLAGARVFELKTVQENDALDIEKPCIDALDEGHNTEWSTELRLEDAREEYLRAWSAVHLLDSIFSERPRSFIFNMSVGYTLAGIRGPKVDAFIEGMRRPAATTPRASSSAGFWKEALRELEAFVESGDFGSAFGSAAKTKARAILSDFPAAPVHSVTLSTMHGCPPDEIERIGSYLIEEKGLDTFVKLNPTLLGYDAARSILDATLWKDIEIRRDNFEHDLQFADALGLVASLDAKARTSGRRFGIKLSNTLANANTGGFLPGGERYMSGRALYPLTIALAAKLAAALQERLPAWDSRFSYCGGVWAKNAGELIAAGLGPLTMATDILKPGGYLRLLPAARAAVAALSGSPDRPDAEALARLAEDTLSRPEYHAGWKSGKASIVKPLPLLDCFAAPCVEACPVGQKVPEYIRQKAAGVSEGALETILADNPLPFITGTLCDHVCQEACCRNDYEGPVEIRAVKLACARGASIPARPAPRNAAFKGRVAVIGAGPAGLACAHHLALAGLPVTVFDEDKSAGGVPANVIPFFRIPREDIKADIERIRSLGVEFRFGVAVRELGPLESEGFTVFFVCTGAPMPRPLEIEGGAFPVVDALAFLKAVSRATGTAPMPIPYGRLRHIVVAGGGNTAMDAVRSALRLPGIEEVRLSYRRSRAEMPADEEELRNALEEGGKLMELTLPERSYGSPAGPRLSLRVMELGDRDASGRRSPRPTDRTENVACDLLVSAVGESPDRSLLESLGLPFGQDGRPVFDPDTQETRRTGLYVGGDAARGPASIISAEADGRRAAYAIMRASGIEPTTSSYAPPLPDKDRLALRGEFVEPLKTGARDFVGDSSAFVARESERCLNCDAACLRCVEVCPNRANFALPVAVDGESGTKGFSQAIQILHLDWLCNECGNCGVFCPFEGEPYRGKPTLFRDRAALDASHNSGFAFIGKSGDGESGPYLLMREGPGSAVVEAAYREWTREAWGSPMAAIARTVFRDHPYLPGGDL